MAKLVYVQQIVDGRVRVQRLDRLPETQQAELLGVSVLRVAEVDTMMATVEDVPSGRARRDGADHSEPRGLLRQHLDRLKGGQPRATGTRTRLPRS